MNIKDFKVYEGKDIKYDKDMIETKERTEGILALCEISIYIKNYRKKNNLTQVELAELLEVNQVMISKLERGNYNPTIKQLMKISYKLTGSNKMFIDIMKNITKSIKEDYTYSYEEILPKKVDSNVKKYKTKKEITNNKTKKVVKRKKVCA